jgi:large subunit ribosomal protein L28
MAMRCEICGKRPVVGRNISHAHNVTPRRFEPNLQTVRAVINGGTRRIRVCTRCLRSG